MLSNIYKYALIIFVLPALLFSQNLSRMIKINEGNVDFSTFTIYADHTSSRENQSILPSDMQIILQNEAEVESQNKIYFTLTSMVFDSDLYVSDVLNDNPSLNEKALSLIRKSTLAGVSYPSRNSIKVDLALPLNKKGQYNIFDMFYNVVYRYDPKPLITYFNAAKDFDCLVIDARGLDINAAIFPSVYDEDGNLIYDISFVDEKYLSEEGYLKYIFDAKDITKLTNPYSIVAWGARGRTKCDIVISNEDARLIASNKGLQNALRRCNVVVILGTKVSPVPAPLK